MIKSSDSVLIVSPIIAHYREELFSSVSNLLENITIASDFRVHPQITNLNTSQLLKIDNNFKFVSLKNLLIIFFALFNLFNLFLFITLFAH